MVIVVQIQGCEGAVINEENIRHARLLGDDEEEVSHHLVKINRGYDSCTIEYKVNDDYTGNIISMWSKKIYPVPVVKDNVLIRIDFVIADIHAMA